MKYLFGKRLGIKQQLTIIIGIFVMVLIFVISYFNVTFSKKIVTKTTKDIMPQMVYQTANLVLQEVKSDILYGETIASNPLIYDISKNFDDKKDSLEESKSYNKILDIGLGDLNGNIIYTDGTRNSVKLEDYYKRALLGENSIQLKNSSNTSDKFVISYAIPVKDKQGSVISVLMFDKAFDDISDSIDKLEFLKTGSAFLYDKEGTLIGTFDKTLVENKINPIKEGKKNSKFESLGSFMEFSMSNDKGISEYTYDGVKKVVAYQRIPELGWIVAISVSYDDIQSGAIVITQSAIIVGLLGITISIIVCIFISHKITSIIKLLVNKLEKMRSGDFSVIIDDKLLKREDEIGLMCRSIDSVKNSVKNMVIELDKVGINTNNNANNIFNFSGEMSNSMENINFAINEITQGITKQTEDINEIFIQTEKFSEKLDVLNSCINEVQKNTLQIKGNTNESKEIVDRLEKSISKFDEQFMLFKSIVEDLGKDMNSINFITNIITDISDQTNLLALNAAIEAARAGEAGKGFSVVAEEIRILAEQSKENSDKIAKIIGKSYENTKKIVDRSRIMNDELDKQTENIDEVKNVFGKMFSSIEDVIPHVEKIYEEIKIVRTSQDNIHLNIHNVLAVSEQVAAASEEILASSNELKSGSDKLNDLSKTLNEDTNTIMSELDNFKIEDK